jgi:N-acetylglucosaminyldiphosphoundecaprenol N-acetyl-beta-D-mannosaminyltransferase
MSTGETTMILGIPVSTARLPVIVERAISSIDGGCPPTIVSCANPHSLVVARDDALFRGALLHSTYVLPDGIGVVWGSRLSRRRIERRIAGWDFFDAMMRALDARGKGRVFFLGSTQTVLDKIAARLARDFPGLDLCGVLSPPFGQWPEGTNDAILEEITTARPDVLWVGMTAPKQEVWVHENRDRLAVPVVGSIGAVFDFYAGTARRASPWLQKAGLEWLPRLIRNPRRLWKRTFVSAPTFATLVLDQHVRALLRRDQGPRTPERH